MSFSVQEILSWCGGKIVNEKDLEVDLKEVRIESPHALLGATSSHLAYFFSKKFVEILAQSQPGVLITGPDFVEPLSQSGLPLWVKTVVISTTDPYLAMAEISQKMAPALTSVYFSDFPEKTKIHPTAVIDSSCDIGPRVEIGPYAVIEEGTVIGEGVRIGAHCCIGPRSQIGSGTVLFPHVTLYERTHIGERCRIHSGVVIGCDGFGYAQKIEAGKLPVHRKIVHFGRVVIGDETEVGANTCIDRGTVDDTRIGSQVIIDDHVMIGHNVQVDDGAIICGFSGYAGSSRVGKFATVGGYTGVVNQVFIEDFSKVAGGSFVINDVPSGEVYAGNPARSYREHFKINAMLNRMLKKKKGSKNE
ncbi:MAG: UDP-3-O-(3-hydroxymyristoyl)glucosamine N-acyltransferase [Bdellovibrionaceae bacterium]|nr:UDP-3-O-(3-hydroxymyristoyl)glucosamine N-acyltransferase [Pseudobdellovibrionaceae bacterium]